MFFLVKQLKGQLLQLGIWAYMSGKLYTVVFVRLDPSTPAEQPVLALTILLAEAVVGLVLSCLCIRALSLKPAQDVLGHCSSALR